MTEQSELLSRAAVYRLLGRLWRREVDQLTLAELASGEMREAILAAGVILPQAVDASSIDELAFDYCQIFLGPSSHLPPYQSVWTEGQFQGAAIVSLAQYIDLLTTDEWAGEAMLDHFGIELEVMAHLVEQVAIAIGSPKVLSHSVEVAATFFRDHLSWADPLCQAASERAQTDFYRSMIELTVAFLGDERAALYLSSHA